MDIGTASILLAILCIIGLATTVYILRIQVPLLKVIESPEIMLIKYTQFSIIIFATIALLILFVIDILTIGGVIARSANTINPVGVIVVFLLPITLDLVLAAKALMYGTIKRNNAITARLADLNLAKQQKMQGKNNKLQSSNNAYKKADAARKKA